MSAATEHRYLIGVDIGGTFTDCVVVDSAGGISIGKVPSTPPDFETGFIESLRETAHRMGIDLAELIARADGIYHGCTVGTNALVENRTAKVGALMSAGHGDTLFIMQAGGRLIGFDPRYVAHIAAQSKPEPLVPKHLLEEVDERIAFDGKIVAPLNEDRCRAAIRRLIDKGVEAFAISLLWSTADPVHERRVAELVREQAPDAFVSVSSEVIARTGEYPRTVAAVVNALIGPVTSTYLGKLEGRLAELGYEKTLYIMSCSGGLIDSGEARRLPLLTIGSGPVAGLIGAGNLARAASTSESDSSGLDVVTGDMGGTTFDVGVIRRGQPISRSTTRHGQWEYFVPTLDVRSIGAGGGSIIHYDPETRGLKVGPQSAGARPGPAAYLRGGTEATVTDADLVLGYLNPDYFLGGNLALGLDAAREALGRAGEPLGFSPEQTAAAAARIVDSQMADAIRLASVQQGYDPRDSVMYAYGGAGAVHCPAVAAQLGITKMIVPLGDLASGWSAFGVASSDILLVQEAPIILQAPFDSDRVNAIWHELEQTIAGKLERQGISVDEVVWERSADLRYALQINEVSVEAPLGEYDAARSAELTRAFEEEYERLFGEGSGFAAAGITLTSMRVRARVQISDLNLAARREEGTSRHLEPVSSRNVLWYELGTDPVPTPVYNGASATAGAELEGPAIVEFVDTTLVLRHGQSARIDHLGSIVVTL